MQAKNINQSTTAQTLIPIWFIDNYKDDEVKIIFNAYKFKNARQSRYLLNLSLDICIDFMVQNPDSNIVFTYPPSTMFYRKEKDIDSMGNLITQTEKNINFYFRKNNEAYYFKSLFSINQKYLKNKKAQHIDGSRESRTTNLDKRYYLNFWNRRFLRKLSKRKTIIFIIDDVSSTGGTLLACKNCLHEFAFDIQLFSIAH